MPTTIDKIYSQPLLYSGKVRDLYNIDEEHMLMVASDRISTFDVILNQLIPNKGVYLTQISLFWFHQLKNIVANHLTNKHIADYLTQPEIEYAKYRSSIVKKLKPIPVEIIIRGYLAGTGYKDYVKTGKICGVTLPYGLQNAEKLSEPIFTPSTKAAIGTHDENISIAQCQNIIGTELTTKLEDIGLKLYTAASKLALSHGIIIADTKFELGLDKSGTLTLMDEVLTPDSSRFWDINTYEIGTNPPSFDKQFVRDYLEKDLKWDKNPPIPDLPEAIINNTATKYLDIMKRLNINCHT
jgi:phosphoribosylaminoimidazole-succinocarboxamide synthase